MKEQDFAVGIDGTLWIRKNVKKNKKMGHIPAMPAAQKILDKFNGDAECEINGTLLPVPGNQKMNAYPNEIPWLTPARFRTNSFN